MAYNNYDGGRGGSRGDFQNRPPRQMVQGNWKCSECGAEITEMPFEPSADRPIYCRQCWRNKNPRFGR